MWALTAARAHSSATRSITWERFSSSHGWSLIGPKRTFSPEHVLQGGVGDCWFLSSVAVIAEREDLIRNIVISPDGSLRDEEGVSFRLFIDGNWRVVTVDNHLPCRASPRDVRPTLAFSHAANSFLWVPFLEKAYAKIYGSYRAISGGFIRESMLDLTGAPCEEINFSSTSFNSDEAWEKLVSFHSSGFPIGCSTAVSGEGIVGRHAYSVLEVREVEGAQLGAQSTLNDISAPRPSDLLTDEGHLRVLKIRNPWGKKEWQGELSRHSDAWTSKLQRLLERGSREDGTFWMSYHDFLRRFESVDVCKAREASAGWVSQSLTDSFRYGYPRHFTSDSCFRVTVLDSTWTYFTLVQQSQRGRERYWFASMSLLLCRLSLSDQKDACDDFRVVDLCLCNARRDTPALECHLSPGSYLLVPLHFPSCSASRVPSLPQTSERRYSLVVYSSCAVVVESVPAEDLVKDLPRRWIAASPPLVHVGDRLLSLPITSSSSSVSHQGVIDLTEDEEATLLVYSSAHGAKLFAVRSRAAADIRVRVALYSSNYFITSLVNDIVQTPVMAPGRKGHRIDRLEVSVSPGECVVLGVALEASFNDEAVLSCHISDLFLRLDENIYIIEAKFASSILDEKEK